MFKMKPRNHGGCAISSCHEVLPSIRIIRRDELNVSPSPILDGGPIGSFSWPKPQPTATDRNRNNRRPEGFAALGLVGVAWTPQLEVRVG